MPAGAMDSISTFFQGPGMLIVLLIAMFAIMILPQRKKDKKMREMLSSLKPGDKIRTIGGFYGKIFQVKEEVLVIEVGPDKTKLTIAKSAVSTVENAEVENDSLEAKK